MMALIAFPSMSQESSFNFSIDNGKIIWQKVFDTDLNSEQITILAQESGIMRDINVSENRVSGQIELMEPDYRGAGYGEMSTPIFISRSFVECFALIELRDGRYRVTLRNIALAQKYNDGVSKEGEKSTLESYALNRRGDEMKKGFLNKPAEILNYTFIKSFTVSASKQDEDW